MTFSLDVLIPHYRDPKGLQLSLGSVAQQTWRGRLRVVVVDDGSDDEDFRLVEAHCASFREESGFDFLLMRNAINSGRPRTRNRLLELVEASHVAWLDAGDVWYPDKLSVQFEHLARIAELGQHIDTIWITCSYDWVQNGQSRKRTQEVVEDQLSELLAGTRLRAYLWTLLGTAKAFRIAGRFDERLLRLQDLDYFVTFLRAGGRIEVPPVTEALCRYFKSDIGRSASAVHDAYKLILAKHAPELRRRHPSLSSKAHYKSNSLAARFARSNGQHGVATAYMLQAALGSPRYVMRALGKRVAQRIRRQK